VGKIERFEDIEAWQAARKLVREIYDICKDSKVSKDFEFKSQIQKAAVSIMSNIAEGFERNSNNELARFLNIAKGSVAEVRSLLYVAVDLNYLAEDRFITLKSNCEMISKQLWNFVKYLKTDNKVDRLRS
jgi:four helix bundle protein